jgi:ketosteroid isomerase-like protein
MNRTIIVIVASVLTVVGATSALASDRDDVMAVLNQWNDADSAKSIASCADDAAVIDDFPPFEWRGAGACANWSKAFDGFAQQNGITDPAGTIGKPKQFTVSGDRAYVVVPATFGYTMKGKPVKLTAIATFSLHKTASGWRITSWSWATTNISQG